MLIILTIVITALLLTFNIKAAHHAYHSPQGYWYSTYFNSNSPQAVVKISKTTNEKHQTRYHGVAVTGWPNPNLNRSRLVCRDCPQPFTNKFLGCMKSMWNYKRSADNHNIFTDGKILDGFRGRVFKSRLTLSNDGQMLSVLGYIGFYFIGRSQHWQRITQEQAEQFHQQAMLAWQAEIQKHPNHYKNDISFLRDSLKIDDKDGTQALIEELSCPI